jgi:hypothetical protein
MTRNALRLRSLFVLAALVVSGACRDVVDPKQDSPADPFARMRAGLHPVVVVTEAGPVTTYAQLRLRPVQTHAPIASFQAELAYDTVQLSVVGADFPAGIDGAWNEERRGVVRFAGVSPAGIDDAPLATVRFAAKAPAARRAFRLELQELVGADDFRDLLPLVAVGEPVVVASYPAQK